jgi:hypothetical protein
VFADVITWTPHTVAVLIAGDADVAAAVPVAAVSFCAFRVADVRLVVADELIRPLAEMGRHGDRQRIVDLHLVFARPHDDFEHPRPAEPTPEPVVGAYAAATWREMHSLGL